MGEVRAQLTQSNKERDDAKSALATAEGTIEKRDETIKTLGEKIKALENTDPLAAYSGWDLILKGINKIRGKK